MTIDYTGICRNINEEFLETDLICEAHYRMRLALEQADAGLQPLCTLVVGQSGVGKTKTVREFQAGYCIETSESGRKSPVVYCRLEANSSVDDLTVKMLEVLDVPIPYRGTRREKRKLLYKSLMNAGVRMIIFDESQQIIDKRTERVRYQFVDELKLLIDELSIAIVLVGLPSLLDASKVNSQLERRSYPPIELRAFDYADYEDQIAFICLVNRYVKLCHPVEFPNFSNKEMSWRLYCACAGLCGRLANLFKQCVHDCQDGRRRTVTIGDLAKAVDRAIYRLPSGVKNPFKEGFDLPVTKRAVGVVMGHTNAVRQAILEGDRVDYF